MAVPVRRTMSMTALALGVGSGMLLAGCSVGSDPGPDESPGEVPSTSASAPSVSPSGSASPSPSSTLTAAQQQAFEEATEVVMAYRQTLVDLYSGARTGINDLDNYVTGGFLETERNGVSQNLAKGIRSEPQGAQLVLVSAEPEKVSLETDPNSVVLWACIDGTGLTGIDAQGNRTPGVRGEAQYRVIQTTYLPDPGWAVAEVKAARDPKDRAC